MLTDSGGSIIKTAPSSHQFFWDNTTYTGTTVKLSEKERADILEAEKEAKQERLRKRLDIFKQQRPEIRESLILKVEAEKALEEMSNVGLMESSPRLQVYTQFKGIYRTPVVSSQLEDMDLTLDKLKEAHAQACLEEELSK